MSGYATSATYHKKLFYLIETYELWRFDLDLITLDGKHARCTAPFEIVLNETFVSLWKPERLRRPEQIGSFCVERFSDRLCRRTLLANKSAPFNHKINGALPTRSVVVVNHLPP